MYLCTVIALAKSYYARNEQGASEHELKIKSVTSVPLALDDVLAVYDAYHVQAERVGRASTFRRAYMVIEGPGGEDYTYEVSSTITGDAVRERADKLIAAIRADQRLSDSIQMEAARAR
jgi:hypothetical protein